MGFDVTGELQHSVEKLRAPAVAFGSVVGFYLQNRKRTAFLWRLVFPPRVEAIHNEVAGLCGAIDGEVQLSSALFLHTKGSVFFLASHVVVIGLVIATCLTATAVIANVHRCLAVHAQADDRTGFARPVLFVNVGENGISFRNFLGVWP